MEITPALNIARGEVLLTVLATAYPVKFNLNVLRDWSRLTGRAPSDFGQLLTEDYAEALTSLLTCAVRRFVPGQAAFSQDDAADLLDAMSADEATTVAEAITEAVTVVNPLLAALSKQVAAKSQALRPEPLPASGTTTSA